MNVLQLVQTSSQDTRVFQQQVWSLLLGTLGWPVYRSQPFLQNALATQRTIECVIPLDIWRLLLLPLSQLSMVSPNIWIQLIHIQKKSQRHFLRLKISIIILDTPPSSVCRHRAFFLGSKKALNREMPESFRLRISTGQSLTSKQENATFSHWNSSGC